MFTTIPQERFLIKHLYLLIQEQARQMLSGEYDRFHTVTLVGSTKFPEVWKETQRLLTMEGAVVHTVGLFGHQENIDMNGSLKRLLDKVYLQKIRESESILVLNKNGYIGNGAWDEIFYAIAHKKYIYFLEPFPQSCFENLITLIVNESELLSRLSV